MTPTNLSYLILEKITYQRTIGYEEEMDLGEVKDCAN